MKKYAENVKTLEDVARVPETEFILMMDYKNYTCPFCGKPLTYEIVGFGRDKCRQYHSCTCEVAQVAEKHNKRQKELEHEAWQKEQEKRAEARAKEREEEAKKPVTITAAQMFSVASGSILPGIEPVPAEDAIQLAMEHAGFSKGNNKAKLFAYAKANGFDDSLEKAAKEIASFVVGASWNTDISSKVKSLCSSYGIPETLTL